MHSRLTYSFIDLLIDSFFMWTIGFCILFFVYLRLSFFISEKRLHVGKQLLGLLQSATTIVAGYTVNPVDFAVFMKVVEIGYSLYVVVQCKIWVP